jgi:hypothetical protein
MKFIGKDIKEVNKGYFGVRRCTICKDELRDVNLVELHVTNHFCFIPIKSEIAKRILVCSHCNAYMEINNKLWSYYESYYNSRFSKATTDNIVGMLTRMSSEMEKNGVKLSIGDDSSEKSLDMIFSGLANKYGVEQNVEEIISVFYK